MNATAYPHIVTDEQGRLRIGDAGIKLRMFVGFIIADGWGPKDFQEQYPQLTLGEIHAAMSYYYDHKAELDAEVEASRRYAEEMRAAAEQAQPPLTREELLRRLAAER